MKAAATVSIDVPDGLHGEDIIVYFQDQVSSIGGKILDNIQVE